MYKCQTCLHTSVDGTIANESLSRERCIHPPRATWNPPRKTHSPSKGLPLTLVLFLPPKVEVRDLGPDELAVGVRSEGVCHEAQDVARLATVVVLKGAYPARVIVRVRYHKHLRKRGRGVVYHSLST